MSTKKILLIVGGVVAACAFVVALIVGAVVFVAYSTIGKSEAAQTAKAFLQRNEKLKSDIGEVRDFGFWISGGINTKNSDGEATLNLKVIGAKKTVPASVTMTYRNGRSWIVTGATYRNDVGAIVELLDKYEVLDRKELPHTEEALSGVGEYISEVTGEDFDDAVLHAPAPVLVVFASTASAETIRLLPALTEVAKKYSPRVRCYVSYADVDHELARRNDVQLIPTLILFRDGKERERMTGAHPAAELSRMIEKQLKK